MKIIHLPPQEAPKQPTARYTTESLGEHAIAFLNANNKKSWAEYQPEELDNLSTFLGGILNQKELTREALKAARFRIGKEFLPKMGTNKTYDMLARLLGYELWGDAIRSAPDSEPIKNLNYSYTVTRAIDLGHRQSNPEDSVFVKKNGRLAKWQGWKDIFKLLSSSCSGPQKMKLKMNLKAAAALLDASEINEERKSNGLGFSVFMDPEDADKFHVVAELPWFCYFPNKDYVTYTFTLILYPMSKSIKSVHRSIEPSEKTYAQFYQEFIKNNNQ